MKAEISLMEIVGLMIKQSNSLRFAFSTKNMAFIEREDIEGSTDDILSVENSSGLGLLSSTEIIPIPSKTEINEFAIMKQFAHQLYNPEITKEILTVMHGSGVFKRFNEIIARRGIDDDWKSFRMQAMKKHAIDWCNKNRFSYIDDMNR